MIGLRDARSLKRMSEAKIFEYECKHCGAVVEKDHELRPCNKKHGIVCFACRDLKAWKRLYKYKKCH